MRTREAARPDAHAPARPRSRVVRARTWVRAPPMVLPDAVRKPSARSPRSDKVHRNFSGIFFEIFIFFLKKKYDQNTPVSDTLAVIRVYRLKKREHVKNAYVISHIFVRKPL